MVSAGRLGFVTLLLATLLWAIVGVSSARAVALWTPVAAATELRGTSVSGVYTLPGGNVLVLATDNGPHFDSQQGRYVGLNGGGAARYDLAAGTWAATGPMIVTGRNNAANAQLADGDVLSIGGMTWVGNDYVAVASAERYSAATNSWRRIADLPAPRESMTATVLGAGRVLALGGTGGPNGADGYADDLLYDPDADRWSALASPVARRIGNTAILLADGRVLVAGGSKLGGALADAYLYDPQRGRWLPTGGFAAPRDGYVAVVLRDGRVLALGGERYAVGTGELYDPASGRWIRIARIPSDSPGHDSPYLFAAEALPDGSALLIGGLVAERDCQNHCSSVPTARVWRYDPVADVWSAFTPLNTARDFQRGNAPIDGSTLLSDGRVFVAQVTPVAGEQGPWLVTAEIYGEQRAPERCFAETGKCARGPFLRYWEAHGGLTINGYPISDERRERLEDGQTYTVQYFERVRLEYHPENAAPNDILLGQFGRHLHPADPPAPPQPGATYFAETGHNVDGGFLDYWWAHGGLAQFGYPLTEVITETLGDGKRYRVQYFERARFEYHPENAAPYDVLLGQFGRAILDQSAAP